MSDQRLEKAQFRAWVAIIGNSALAAMKAIVGFASGSKALLADAANSASDVVGAAAVQLGLKAAKQPTDESGLSVRAKRETAAAVAVSVLLLVFAVEIGYHAFQAIIRGVEEAPDETALIVVAISVVVKEFLYQYNFRRGKKQFGHPLMAAWDHRTDVSSSVAVLIGVGGAVLGSYAGEPMLYWLDPIASIFVAFLVAKTACKLVMKAVLSTIAPELHREETEELLDTVLRVKGVIAVNDLRAREQGHYVIVELKISVNPKITVNEGYDIGKAVKYQLMNKFSHISDVFIHVNPYDPGYPYKNVSLEHPDFPSVLH
ncbi:MAG: cation transporter [Paenibacillus sp.]|nr:cation transporter [Paenibacillus sp.]